MKLLTDTHTLVWALPDPRRLGAKARNALLKGEVSASAVNLWELCLKADKPGSLIDNPIAWWEKYVTGQGVAALSILTGHWWRKR